MSFDVRQHKVRLESRVIGLVGCAVVLAGGCGGSSRSVDGAGPDVRESGTSATDGRDAARDLSTGANDASLDGAGDARDGEDAAADLPTSADGPTFDGPGDAPDDGAGDARDDDARDASGPTLCPMGPENDAGAARPDAAHGSIVEFALPAVFTDPFFIAAAPDGRLWFSGGAFAFFATITTDGCVSEHPSIDYPAMSPLTDMALGSDGNVWFCQIISDPIGRIAPDGSALREFALPARTAPRAVTLGPDGNIWFAAEGSIEIGRITPAGDVTSFPTFGAPYDITSGPGGQLWFTTRANTAAIGSIDPATGTILEFVVPDGGDARWIASGSDGNLWFINYRTTDGYFVTRVTPSQTFTDFPVGDGGFLMHIISGPDGNLWMAEQDANKIARLSPSTGVVTEYDVPTPNSQPSAIAVGPDGNIWFTERLGNKIGRLTP